MNTMNKKYTKQGDNIASEVIVTYDPSLIKKNKNKRPRTKEEKRLDEELERKLRNESLGNKLSKMAQLNHSDSNDIVDTSPTYKALEEGSEAQSKEEIIQMAQRQQKFIKGLEAALIRIENKTYGIDRETGELIPKERLRAVPHATLSVASKEARNRK